MSKTYHSDGWLIDRARLLGMTVCPASWSHRPMPPSSPADSCVAVCCVADHRVRVAWYSFLLGTEFLSVNSLIQCRCPGIAFLWGPILFLPDLDAVTLLVSYKSAYSQTRALVIQLFLRYRLCCFYVEFCPSCSSTSI